MPCITWLWYRLVSDNFNSVNCHNRLSYSVQYCKTVNSYSIEYTQKAKFALGIFVRVFLLHSSSTAPHQQSRHKIHSAIDDRCYHRQRSRQDGSNGFTHKQDLWQIKTINNIYIYISLIYFNIIFILHQFSMFAWLDGFCIITLYLTRSKPHYQYKPNSVLITHSSQAFLPLTLICLYLSLHQLQNF